MTVCRRITLKARPRGMPTVDDFALEEIELLPLGDDQVTVAVRFLSVDAFIRTTLEEGGIHATIPLGAPVVALGVGEVIDSTSSDLAAGDWVNGPMMAQTHAQMRAALFQKIDTDLAPPSAWLGALGLTTGLTAYFGLLAVVHVDPGDTVVVSGAAARSAPSPASWRRFTAAGSSALPAARKSAAI